MSDDLSGYLFIGLIALIGVFFVLALAVPIDYTYQIKSLNDGSEIRGSFVLGSGYIDEEPVFIVYSMLQNGGYKLETIDADDTIIYEDNPSHPYVHVYGCARRTYNDIHVPKGTIVQQYNLDGKLK